MHWDKDFENGVGIRALLMDLTKLFIYKALECCKKVIVHSDFIENSDGKKEIPVSFMI